MTRLQALEAVAEAAEILTHSAGVIRGKTPEDDDMWTVELEHIRELNAALAALSALPREDEDEGQTVEVLLIEDRDGYMRIARPGSREARYVESRPELTICGTTRLAVKKGEGA